MLRRNENTMRICKKMHCLMQVLGHLWGSCLASCHRTAFLFYRVQSHILQFPEKLHHWDRHLLHFINKDS